MGKKSEIERMKKAMKAFVESQERDMTPEKRKEQAWFPISIMGTLEADAEKLKEHGQKTAEGLLGLGFTEEELADFSSKMFIFCESLRIEKKS